MFWSWPPQQFIAKPCNVCTPSAINNFFLIQKRINIPTPHTCAKIKQPQENKQWQKSHIFLIFTKAIFQQRTCFCLHLVFAQTCFSNCYIARTASHFWTKRNLVRRSCRRISVLCRHSDFSSCRKVRVIDFVFLFSLFRGRSPPFHSGSGCSRLRCRSIAFVPLCSTTATASPSCASLTQNIGS